ncbi:hypothetical protein [Spirosoma sp.]|uniref:hypothetical protein n=1 Tax=Spirosoma sp. TaxID=1899569 RepID=UPI003B3B0E76
MNRNLLFLLSLAIVGCSPDKVSERDFEGKSFKASLKVDPSLTNNNPLAANFMAMAKMQYDFRADHEGVFRTQIGAMSAEHPFKWQLKGDSLTIDRRVENNADIIIENGRDFSETTQHLVKKTEKGIELIDKNARIELLPKDGQ